MTKPYLLQIHDWQYDISYYKNSMVKYEGKIYRLNKGVDNKYSIRHSINERPDLNSVWEEVTLKKRQINIYKPRLRYICGGWCCSSFMNTVYGNTPEEAYSKWKEKELSCSGKRRLDNMVDSTLRNLEKFNEENEILEWDILKKIYLVIFKTLRIR